MTGHQKIHGAKAVHQEEARTRMLMAIGQAPPLNEPEMMQHLREYAHEVRRRRGRGWGAPAGQRQARRRPRRWRRPRRAARRPKRLGAPTAPPPVPHPAPSPSTPPPRPRPLTTGPGGGAPPQRARAGDARLRQRVAHGRPHARRRRRARPDRAGQHLRPPVRGPVGHRQGGAHHPGGRHHARVGWGGVRVGAAGCPSRWPPGPPPRAARAAAEGRDSALDRPSCARPDPQPARRPRSYHSEEGWTGLIDVVLGHYGIEVEEKDIVLFVGIIPIAIDVFFKVRGPGRRVSGASAPWRGLRGRAPRPVRARGCFVVRSPGVPALFSPFPGPPLPHLPKRSTGSSSG
jgi:hypothetical protein